MYDKWLRDKKYEEAIKELEKADDRNPSDSDSEDDLCNILN